MEAKIVGKFVEINWQDGNDQKTLLIKPEDVVKNYHAVPAFERISNDVVLIDGRYYQQMLDDKSAEFIWGKSGLTQRALDVPIVTHGEACLRCGGTEYQCAECLESAHQ